MRLNFKLLLCSIPLLTTACQSEEPPAPDEMPLVVESWINEGENPIVIITRAVDLTADSPSFDDSVEKWCRVSIFDDERQYMLTGRVNPDYTPSFIYTHTSLKGKVGHTYRLLIETADKTYTATQTITPAPKIDRVEPRLVEGSDSLYTLQVFLKDLPEGGHYRIFTRTYRLEQRLYSSFLGSGDNDMYDPASGVNVTRGIHSGYSDMEFDHYFHNDETVMIKVCSTDDAINEFWKSYDRNVSLSQNLFFTFVENCPGNIPDALGYWASYGTSTLALRIPRQSPTK